MSFQQESDQPFRWHYADFDDTNFQIRGRTVFFIIVLLAIMLLIGLLFLYARWVCRFGPRTPAPAPLARSAAAPSRNRRSGLDASTINSYPIVLFKSSGGGESAAVECCICLGMFGDGEKVKVLPECEHRFHAECVDKWLLTQSSCPLCRNSLRVDSVV